MSEVALFIPCSTLSETGSYLFTAANGDVLYATFVGQGTPTGTPGGLTVVAPATILGGSGRFRRATGTFTIMATVSQITLDGSAEFSGTISIPEEERE